MQSAAHQNQTQPPEILTSKESFFDERQPVSGTRQLKIDARQRRSLAEELSRCQARTRRS